MKITMKKEVITREVQVGDVYEAIYQPLKPQRIIVRGFKNKLIAISENFDYCGDEEEVKNRVKDGSYVFVGSVDEIIVIEK